MQPSPPPHIATNGWQLFNHLRASVSPPRRRCRQESSDPCHLYDALCSKLSCRPKIGAVFLMPARLNVIDIASVLFFADSGFKDFNRTVELCHSGSMESNWEQWASLDDVHSGRQLRTGPGADAEIFSKHFTTSLFLGN